jgi:hypothetical protein
MNRIKLYFNIKLKERKAVLFLVLTFFSAIAYSQQVSRVLISGPSGYTSHDTDVKNAFLIGYKSYDGTNYTGVADLHVDNNVYLALEYAHQNNYQIVIRSYTGLTNTVNDSAQKYPDVLLFMPAGSNSFLFYCNLDIPNAAVVSTGAGVDTLVTAYKVEFFSIDPIAYSNESSFSNGYIAGQIAYLANKLNITPQQARLVARNSSSSAQSITYVQYGKIDLGNAVQSSDSTLTLPLELTSFIGTVSNDYVILKWTTSTESNNYGFAIERSLSPTPSQKEGASSTSLWGEWGTIGFVKGSGNSNSTKYYSYIDKDLNNPGEYFYRLKQIDNDGSFKYSNTIQLKITRPLYFELKQNYPNPFNPVTTIGYTISKSAHVKLKVYDLLGNEIATLVNKEEPAGVYSVQLSVAGQHLSSGIYLYQLRADSFIETKKLILLK